MKRSENISNDDPRQCVTCLVIKNADQFGVYQIKGRSYINRRRSCNPCRVIAERKKCLENPDLVIRKKLAAKRSRLKREYGMSIEEYDNFIDKRKGQCDICFNISKTTLNVDHCHDTGKIRGVLCWNCNVGIGYLKHSIKNLKNAIKYLTQKRNGKR